MTGVTLAPLAFYDPHTTALAQLLRELTPRAFDALGAPGRPLHRAQSAFLGVFIVDGSLVRLGDAIERWYPSVWTHHTMASAQLHVITDEAARTPRSFELLPGKSHDAPWSRIGPWVKNHLLIGDLAHYQGKRFWAIQRENGHFLRRVKERAHFVVVGADDPAEVGRRLRAVLPAHRGETVDVEVDSACRHLSERDFVFRHLRLRALGGEQESEQHHRLTVIHASPTRLATQHVAASHAVRWEIELLFRELLRARRLLRTALEYGLTRVLRHEALDPNRSRLPLAARAPLGILRAPLIARRPLKRSRRKMDHVAWPRGQDG